MAGEEIIVGLDIGTSKIAAIIGNTWQGDPEKIEIIGVGTAPSEGLRKGVVVDIDLTTTAIRQAVETAELMAGVQIGSVYAGIAGGHITGQTSHGLVAVSGEGHEITQSDVERAINAAQAMKIPVEREILHVIPQGFIVDEQGGIEGHSLGAGPLEHDTKGIRSGIQHHSGVLVGPAEDQVGPLLHRIPPKLADLGIVQHRPAISQTEHQGIHRSAHQVVHRGFELFLQHGRLVHVDGRMAAVVVIHQPRFPARAVTHGAGSQRRWRGGPDGCGGPEVWGP